MKRYNPTSPGRRGMTIVEWKSVLTAIAPEKSLTRGRKRHVGRNSHGRITTRHKGAGVKRLWRDIDFRYDKPITEVIVEIEKEVNIFLGQAHSILMKEDPEKKDLRWWTCGKWKMPCGGTHPKSTKEIGKIELRRKNIGAGKERIEIRLKED